MTSGPIYGIFITLILVYMNHIVLKFDISESMN